MEHSYILWWSLFVCGLLFTTPYLANNYRWWVLSHLLAVEVAACMHLFVCVCVYVLNGFKAIHFIVINWMNHRQTHTDTHAIQINTHWICEILSIGHRFKKWHINVWNSIKQINPIKMIDLYYCTDTILLLIRLACRIKCDVIWNRIFLSVIFDLHAPFNEMIQPCQIFFILLTFSIGNKNYCFFFEGQPIYRKSTAFYA